MGNGTNCGVFEVNPNHRTAYRRTLKIKKKEIAQFYFAALVFVHKAHKKQSPKYKGGSSVKKKCRTELSTAIRQWSDNISIISEIESAASVLLYRIIIEFDERFKLMGIHGPYNIILGW